MVKMGQFMLCIFYHNKNIFLNLRQERYEVWGIRVGIHT